MREVSFFYSIFRLFGNPFDRIMADSLIIGFVRRLNTYFSGSLLVKACKIEFVGNNIAFLQNSRFLMGIRKRYAESKSIMDVYLQESLVRKSFGDLRGECYDRPMRTGGIVAITAIITYLIFSAVGHSRINLTVLGIFLYIAIGGFLLINVAK